MKAILAVARELGKEFSTRIGLIMSLFSVTLGTVKTRVILLFSLLVLISSSGWWMDSQNKPASYKYTNRLIHEKSPYLLQHAHNPVDWYPWARKPSRRPRRMTSPSSCPSAIPPAIG